MKILTRYAVIVAIFFTIGNIASAQQVRKWVQIWPCASNGRPTVNGHPSTGPGAYGHFIYAGAGTWKRYKVRPNVPVIIRASGDSCPGCMLGHPSFRLYEFIKGKKVEKLVFRGPDWAGKAPPGEPRYRFLYYIPGADEIEIACIKGGFSVAVYQFEIEKNPQVLTDKLRRRTVELIKQLDDDSWRVRHRAQKELEKIGAVILPILYDHLNQHSLEVKLRIKMIIDKVRPHDYVPEATMKSNASELVKKLSALIAMKSLGCDAEPARNLSAIGPYAVEQLKIECGSKNAHVRAAVVNALGKLGEVGTEKIIIELLKKDKDEDVRLRAAAALGNFNSPDVVRALKTASETDPSKRVRSEAIKSLKEISKNIN